MDLKTYGQENALPRLQSGALVAHRVFRNLAYAPAKRATKKFGRSRRRYPYLRVSV